MLTFQKAETLAKTWVDVISEGEAAIMPEQTMDRPYGWVFFYQSKSYIARGDSLDALLGNAPIIVNKWTGEIKVTGTGRPVEEFLAEYEAALQRK